MDVRKFMEQGRYKNKIAYSKETRKEYQAEESRIYEEFRVDLAIEHGLVDHPKEKILFEMAWSHGHASGYSEVVTFYEELVNLIK